MKEYFCSFLVFTVICAILIVQDAEAHGGCCSPYKCCYFPKCCSLGPCCTTDNNTLHAQNVWEKVPETYLTENMKTLRKRLIETTNILHYQPAAFGSILFASEVLLGFDVEPDAMCVFVDLIKKMVQEREGCTEGLVKAIEAFGLLNQKGMNFSRIDILVDIKCATRHENSPKCQCILKRKWFDKIMQIIDLPAPLKAEIYTLYNSGNLQEKKLAIVVIACFTDYAVQMFNLLMSTENYRISNQYYACLRPIPKKCCPVRGKEFSKLVDQALIDNQLIISKIISRLNLKPEDVHEDDEP